jgi:hypothetical protein
MPVVADLLDFGSQTAVAGTPGGPVAKWTYPDGEGWAALRASGQVR